MSSSGCTPPVTLARPRYSSTRHHPRVLRLRCRSGWATSTSPWTTCGCASCRLLYLRFAKVSCVVANRSRRHGNPSQISNRTTDHARRHLPEREERAEASGWHRLRTPGEVLVRLVSAPREALHVAGEQLAGWAFATPVPNLMHTDSDSFIVNQGCGGGSRPYSPFSLAGWFSDLRPFHPESQLRGIFAGFSFS